MKTRMLSLFVIGLLANTVAAEKPWKLDAQVEWVQATLVIPPISDGEPEDAGLGVWHQRQGIHLGRVGVCE